MRTLAAAISTGLLALLVAGTASAVPTVSLFWLTSDGTGTTGGSAIDALSGDNLTLAIDVASSGTAKINALSVSLSLTGGVSYTGPVGNYLGVECPSPPNGADGFCGALVSSGAGSGVQVGPAGSGVGLCPTGSVCEWDAGPSAKGNASFRLGNAIFTVGATSGAISTFYRDTIDSILENSVPFTPSAAAVINVPAAVPEPGTLGLLALGLGALTVAGRSRKV